jgi:hypothetical protein
VRGDGGVLVSCGDLTHPDASHPALKGTPPRRGIF